LLAPWEEYFMNEIGDLPMEKYPAPDIDEEMKQKVRTTHFSGCLLLACIAHDSFSFCFAG
jgi:hypothetical protein